MNATKMNFVPWNETTTDCEETLSFVMDIISEGVWEWDAMTGFMIRSPGWYRTLGYEAGRFENDISSWESVIHPEDSPHVLHEFEHYTSGKRDRYEIDYRCRTAGGGYKWVRDRGRIVARNEDGTAARVIGAQLDIHAQRVAQETLERQNRLLQKNTETLESVIRERTAELEALNAALNDKVREVSYLASTDKLTQLHNRYSFESELEREMARATRYASPMGITLFDIDFFKTINDSYGHSEGDIALSRIGEVVRHCIRKSDIAARWGGDEFAIIFPEADREQTLSITKKLMERIGGIELDNLCGLSGSFGVTQFEVGESRDGLMRRVDEALYAAKNRGRGMICSR